MLLLAIALLFAQAMADLTVPDLLAKIVNVGIQQGGLETAVPEVIRQSSMQKAVLFMSAADKASVLADYTLVDSGSPDYQTYLQKFPGLANEPVYVLNKINQAEMDRLNPVMAKALLAVSGIEQVMKDPSKAAQMGAAFGNFDLSKLPPGTDLFAILGKLPPDQLAKIRAATEQKFAGLGDAVIVKAGASAVQAEYKAMGMIAANKLQTSYILKVGSWMLLFDSGLRHLYGDRRFPFGQDRRRDGAGYAPGCVQDGGRIFQHRVRQVLDRFADHPHHQRRDPDPDAGADDGAHGVLRADHRHRRHHQGRGHGFTARRG